MENDICINNVFYVASPDLMLNPIAIRPRFQIEGEQIISVEWEDTSRGVGFKILEIESPATIKALMNSKKIRLRTDKGIITLTELNRVLFESIMSDVAGGTSLFATCLSDDALKLYFLQTDFNAY